jgi:excisionase family DNA binding protein
VATTGIRKATTRAPSTKQGPDDPDGDWHLWTVSEVARRCGLSEKAVRRAIDDGELRASKLRSRLRIKPEDVNVWIAESSRAARVTSLSRPRRARRSVGQFRALMLDDVPPELQR